MDYLSLDNSIEHKKISVILSIIFPLQLLILFASSYWGIKYVVGAIAIFVLIAIPFINLELSLSILLFFFVFLNRPLTAIFAYKSILVQDIFFVIIVFAWLLKRALNGQLFEFQRSSLTGSYALFLLIGCVAAIVGLCNFNRFNNILYEIRGLAYFLTFFIVLDVIRHKKQIYLILAVFLLSTCFFAFESIIGSVAKSKMIMFSLSTLRYVEPTTFFLALGIVLNVSIILLSRASKFIQTVLFVSTVLMGTALVLSLTRGYWLGLAGGLFFVFLFLPRRKKFTVFLMSFVLVSSGIIGASIFMGFSPKLILDLVSSRAVSMKFFMFDPSAMARIEEIRSILKEIPKCLLFGKGLGASLYLFKYDKGMWMEWIYFHNNYFEILLKMGLLGITAYFIKVFFFFKLGFASLRTRYDIKKALILGILGMYISMMVTSLTSGVILFLDTAPLIGIMMGIVAVIYKNQIVEWHKSPTKLI
ncbi:O-antigen ligase family protein [candidate division WOR-3 bacterium]|nr:O-antigen ligase family protein [candidate division WOR-3 bacterium]